MRLALTATAAMFSMMATCFAGVAQPSNADAGCLELLVDLPAGTVPIDSQFRSVPCHASRQHASFRYDASRGLNVVAHDLMAGNVVHVYPEHGRSLVRPGQVLTLVVHSGPVVVERQVRALQKAASGQSLFVQTESGEVLSVEFDGGHP